MDTINDRIEILINQRFDGNKAAFAKLIGLGPTGLSNYLGTKRRSKPSIDMVTKIIQALNISAEWLLTGKGPMLTEPSPREVRQSSHGDNSPNVYGNGNMVGDVAPAADAERLRERIRHLKDIIAEKDERLAEKERVIALYEKMTERK